MHAHNDQPRVSLVQLFPVLSRAGFQYYSITTNGYSCLTPSNPHITILVILEGGCFEVCEVQQG